MPKARTNQEWLLDLRSDGDAQAAAIEDLRSMLVQAAAFSFSRNLGDLAHYSHEDIHQLAEDCAQDALIAILNGLPDFRGESQFTTWAYKFAINISLNVARRERWKGVSLDELAERNVEDGWPFADLARPDPDLAAIRGEIGDVLAEVIQQELTEKQRLVLKWMVFDEVPMDVVVEHLHTNRNAVYKLLHDARSKLKLALQSRDISLGETIDLFSAQG